MYCCGPEGLLSAVEDACKSWPEGSLHIERFSAKELEAPSPDALATFEVECQRSGLTLTVPPDKSIYEVCEDAGVDVLGSCMEGVCGTCECDVLEGEPDHRDSVLNDAEKARERSHDDLRFTLPLGKAGARPMRPNYPFNCWYVAATSDEVGPGSARAPAAGQARAAVPPRLGRGRGDGGPLRPPGLSRCRPAGATAIGWSAATTASATTPTAAWSTCRRRRTCRPAPECAPTRCTSSRRSSGSGSAIPAWPRCARRRGCPGTPTGRGGRAPPRCCASRPTTCCCTSTTSTSPTCS